VPEEKSLKSYKSLNGLSLHYLPDRFKVYIIEQAESNFCMTLEQRSAGVSGTTDTG